VDRISRFDRSVASPVPTRLLSEGLSPSTYADFLNHGPDRAVRAAAGFEVDLVKQIDRRTNHDPVRRLTAILAADVAGYSRLRGADEEGTHERLKGHLRELVKPRRRAKKVEARTFGSLHRPMPEIRRSPSTGAGVVKNTGEGSLAEFASVVDAIRCAVEVQRGMTARELKKPEEH
jgi:class 3 adenylate cyclase